MNRRSLLNAGIALAVVAPITSRAAPRLAATLYKDPSCSCCESYAKYLDKNGYKVTVIPSPTLEQITLAHGIPQSMLGCHLTTIGDYVFEGHIPAPLIAKFRADPGTNRGLAIPGMPSGLPGMPLMAGMQAQPIQVYLVGPAKPVVFATVD